MAWSKQMRISSPEPAIPPSVALYERAEVVDRAGMKYFDTLLIRFILGTFEK
jgi:hypothetical protein